MTTVSEPIGSCMSSAMTWTLLSVLIPKRFSWLGHVVRMDEDAFSRRVFDSVAIGGWDVRVSVPKTRLKSP